MATLPETKDADSSWERAVLDLRSRTDDASQELVHACFYDDPLLRAAARFESCAEWQATLELLGKQTGRRAALDLGAGRGISSYALAKSGWNVTALEPDPSRIVGAEAIRELARESGLAINVTEEFGESLPFPSGSFDLVYGRQVLHHARDLNRLCSECARVLSPGGIFLAVREHVISRPADLDAFLAAHPLHSLYGGENAFLLSQYREAILGAGLHLERVMGPLESPINYFPLNESDWEKQARGPLARLIGGPLAKGIASSGHAPGRFLLKNLALVASRLSNFPGRLFTFLAFKPAD